MYVSKESAREALAKLVKLSDTLGNELRVSLCSEILYLIDFLEAAEKRLPTEASYEREKERKNRYYHKKKANIELKEFSSQ